MTLLEKIADPTTKKRKEICVFNVRFSHSESHTWVNGAPRGLLRSFSASQPTWEEDGLESPTQGTLQKGCD